MTAAIEQQERPMTFEHTNLKDVQVSTSFGDRPPIPDGFFNLEIVKAELKPYEVGEGKKNAGAKGEFINFQFAIVGDANYTGRRVFQPALFPGTKTDEQLRLVMDATGVPQSTTVGEWLPELVAQKARFYAPVETYDDLDRRTSPPTPQKRTRVVLWKSAPTNI